MCSSQHADAFVRLITGKALASPTSSKSGAESPSAASAKPVADKGTGKGKAASVKESLKVRVACVCHDCQ